MRSTLCTVLQPNKMFGCNTVLDYEMMVTILLASIYNSSLRSIIFGDIRNCYFPARLAFDASGKWYVTPIVSHVGKIYGNVFDFFFSIQSILFFLPMLPYVITMSDRFLLRQGLKVTTLQPSALENYIYDEKT